MSILINLKEINPRLQLDACEITIDCRVQRCFDGCLLAWQSAYGIVG